MSTHDSPDDDPVPRVPDVANPGHETPVTETFDTGTANDPPVGTPGEEPTTLTVDGETVTVPAGSTIIDALERVDDDTVTVSGGCGGLDDGGTGLATDSDVAALCYYDRDGDASDEIGPRSECRTCMVETREHGLVPSCSFPAEDGLTVSVDAPDAAEARSVNLDLVLSNHNLRCTTCNGNGRCELQETAIEQDVDHPRYGVFDERDQYEPIDDTSSFIQIDRNKCILCNRCVDACNDVQVEGVLRMEGSGSDTHIGFQSDAETMADSECVSCGHCATVCPTGSLTEKGIGSATALPIPGFNQRTSVGRVLEHEDVETLDETTAPNRSFRRADDDTSDQGPETRGLAGRVQKARTQAQGLISAAAERALQAGEHTAETVASELVPEGMLFDVSRRLSDVRKRSIDTAETTCGFCSVGCRFEMLGKDDEVLGVDPVTEPTNAPANDFSTCVKGKFGHEFANSKKRLTQPLRRTDEGELEPVSWDEALDYVAERLSDIQREHGVDTVSCLASSKGSNEEAYLVQKFARQVLGTKNIDNCARLCHASTVAALQQTVGFGAMSNRINEDVGEADAYLLTGSNTTESHPVLATRIKQNVRDGADLVVFDPRKIGIAEHADQFTRVRPGYDTAWINGLIRYIVEHDLHDTEFIERNTRNFEAVVEKVEPFTPEKVEELTEVPPADLASAAETLAAADTVVFGWAMGMTQSSHGTQNVIALADLALALGQVGKRGAGLSPFRGQNNVQGGGGDMGTLPNCLPGYQDLADPAVLDTFEDSWGERPPDEPGLKVPQMFDEVHEGNLRGMYVVGENPALSEPDIQHAAEALDELEFLVVQDIFLTETAEYADVILPAATSPEKHGTFTNTERRIQRVRPVSEPPGKARQDWEITQALARRLGYDWDYDHPREVMAEINGLVPIYGGVTYERLEEGDQHGLQWPCWDEDHPGTPYLYDYEDGEFNFDDGKARFVPADVQRPGEETDEEFPLTLTTGRVLYHWHTGQLTRRVEGLMSHVGESFVEVHPDTAAELGIADEEYVRVESRRGDIVVKVQVTDRVGPGTLFIPMHFAAGAVNKLTQESFDPQAGIPEYKVSSVRVEPLGPETDEAVLRTPDAGKR
ncbi:formate dehydrogenase subunit alpha [Haloarchaeobius sp. HME9146]|uniref:formate dehydrogenase subunit alpha n=1 Tax=Haloarchaeobius sp. HME9146 TaxID=2978732 RepID=UPI0021BF62C5|nr:formate dehydrogenase subunit alpha [Haloarchaeobius sp. HME9146]MCT9097987.1 formate dehydrogenase subunit alpha [Haloarchaeobius sp. HME9146]